MGRALLSTYTLTNLDNRLERVDIQMGILHVPATALDGLEAGKGASLVRRSPAAELSQLPLLDDLLGVGVHLENGIISTNFSSA